MTSKIKDSTPESSTKQSTELTQTSNELEQCSVKQSFSATGRPLDNAVAETFFATFKREEAYRREYTSEKHFRKCTDSYIQFYNEIRPHQTLNYENLYG